MIFNFIEKYPRLNFFLGIVVLLISLALAVTLPVTGIVASLIACFFGYGTAYWIIYSYYQWRQ